MLRTSKKEWPSSAAGTRAGPACLCGLRLSLATSSPRWRGKCSSPAPSRSAAWAGPASAGRPGSAGTEGSEEQASSAAAAGGSSARHSVRAHTKGGGRYKAPARRDLLAAIACGDDHSCAITEDGLLYMWGSNECGQLGLGPACASVSTKKRSCLLHADWRIERSRLSCPLADSLGPNTGGPGERTFFCHGE